MNLPSKLFAGLLGCFLFMHATADEAGLDAIRRSDWARALKELRPAAERGERAAQINLGNLYMKGLGVQQDYVAARDWYVKAAVAGDPIAQGKLGLLNFYGLGVATDRYEAARWFRRAAEQDEVSAQFVLGTMLADGDGVPKDLAEAYFWLSAAADQHHPEAEQRRAALADRLSPGELNDALTRLETWRKARETDPESALRTLQDAKLPPEAKRSAAQRSKGQAARHRQNARTPTPR